MQVAVAQDRLREAFESRLAAAHSRIETRFLDGGAVLVSIIEILNRLIGSLDQLTGSLDGTTTRATMERIRATVRDLAALPEFEQGRQQGFERLAGVCRAMEENVAEMRETMRYLRTFAITVKITGAGLDEFSGFADEIRERIQSGTAEVDRFAQQLRSMHEQLLKARLFSGGIRDEYRGIVPRLVAELDADAGKLAEHHDRLSAMASEVKTLAKSVQAKIATVLSALQIGDITRQRIEHIQSTFVLLDGFLASDEGLGLDAGERLRLDAAVRRLAAAQMAETVGDFERECRNIHKNMARFIDDTQAILTLRDGMNTAANDDGQGFLNALERNVAAASTLVGRVQVTSNEADEVAQSTTHTAQELIQGISVIRAIKTDIHYMALNSNLRCSRLGEDGRSVNVVSAELRIYAGKLEVPADAITEELLRLEAAAKDLALARDVGGGDLSLPLNEALGAIQDVCGRMDAGLDDLEREGQEVFVKVSAAINSLDFESELGETLRDCLMDVEALASGPSGDVSDLADRISDLSRQIFGLYTMAQERDIHGAFLPVASDANLKAQATIESDDDLFADALF
jgi:hypothetical protein